MMTQFLLVGGCTFLSAVATLTYPSVWYLWLITFLGIAEFTLSFSFIQENERAVPVLLGRIQKELGATLTKEEQAIAENPLATPEQRAALPQSGVFGTGVAFFLFPFYQLRRYPMTIQQIKVTVGKVVTRPGSHQVPHHPDRQLGTAELDLEVVVNFQWDVSNLAPAVANAPPPLGPDGRPHPDLVAILAPEVGDATKTAAAARTWYDVYYDRGGMEQAIKEYLLPPLQPPPPPGQAPRRVSALVRAGLRDSARISISLPKVDLPEALKTTINKEQVALFKGNAARRAADAERYKREQEGAGIAEARKKLFEAIRGASPAERDTNLLAEAFLTLREMAQGRASTIFVPESVTRMLGRVSAEDRIQPLFEALTVGLTPEQRDRLIATLEQALKKL